MFVLDQDAHVASHAGAFVEDRVGPALDQVPDHPAAEPIRSAARDQRSIERDADGVAGLGAEHVDLLDPAEDPGSRSDRGLSSEAATRAEVCTTRAAQERPRPIAAAPRPLNGPPHLLTVSPALPTNFPLLVTDFPMPIAPSTQPLIDRCTSFARIGSPGQRVQLRCLHTFIRAVLLAFRRTGVQAHAGLGVGSTR